MASEDDRREVQNQGRPGEDGPGIDSFLGEPTRDLREWYSFWSRDLTFPISTHRGLIGRLAVFGKRLLRPLVKSPQADLWERQRVFNLMLLEWLIALEGQEERVRHLKTFLKEGLDEVMRYGDALYSRVDQKLDRYSRDSREQSALLRGALSASSEETAGGDELARALEESDYRALEDRYRGSEEDIAERVRRYLPWLSDAASAIDLGCGRGEALEVLREAGIAGRGIDASAEMIRACREKGLEAEQGDLFASLAKAEEGSVDAVLSFHVIEHLEPDSLGRLASLAYRVLRPGGLLILETPSPLSLVAGARNFWLDPTHRRPVHPDSLLLALDRAGFVDTQRLDVSPFAAERCLPEIELEDLGPEAQLLADRINRLRDRLDDLLFGYQDFAVIGKRPS